MFGVQVGRTCASNMEPRMNSPAVPTPSTLVAPETPTVQFLTDRADSQSLIHMDRVLQQFAKAPEGDVWTLRCKTMCGRPSLGEMHELLLHTNRQLELAVLQARTAAENAIAQLEQLTRTSQRDPLTGLANRSLMLDRLENALAMAKRRCSRAAVVFIDIDHFKEINDTLGHATGDAVLQCVAQRLQSAVRDSDAVGRHGGDEFLVLLAEVSRLSDAAQIAGKMISEVAVPTQINGHTLHIEVSVGISIYPDDAHEAYALIALADAAMYRSKKLAGGCFTFSSDPRLVSSVEDASAQESVRSIAHRPAAIQRLS